MSDTIIVKKVDKSIYARLKSIAVLRGITVGEALTEAMKLWLLFNEPPNREYLEHIMARKRVRRH